MKKIILPLLVLAFIVAFSSCKEKEENIFTDNIYGTLYDSCGGNPVAGASLELWNSGRDRNFLAAAVDAELLSSFTTDSDGNFNVTITNESAIGPGFIKYNGQIILQGNLSDHSANNSTFDLGELHTIPLKRKFNITFKKTKDWKNGEYVVVRNTYLDFDQRDDTFNMSNSNAVGRSLYTNAHIYYSTNVRNNNSTDTISVYGKTIIFWRTSKSKESSTEYYYTSPCDTSSGYMLLSE
ncbi:MAG: hypothetical protein COA58_04555 [Bacteroidetes bacterium]|nr:MAG: hypothetical protein COA58_04555 [Bacteroidota bacterium]